MAQLVQRSPPPPENFSSNLVIGNFIHFQLYLLQRRNPENWGREKPNLKEPIENNLGTSFSQLDHKRFKASICAMLVAL